MAVADRPGSTGEHELQLAYGTAGRASAFYRHQMLDRLNPDMQEFVAAQEMVFVSTADAGGACDSSFRAGPPGFVRVLDERTLAYPEYRGNGVMASLGNISENPRIGLLFVDFLRDGVGLHVNGGAAIVEDADMRLRCGLRENAGDDASPAKGESGRIDGRPAERWVLVTVHEAYIHCSKHIPLLAKRDKAIDWGTDDPVKKGGDYFGAKGCPRPWATASPAPAPVAPG